MPYKDTKDLKQQGKEYYQKHKDKIKEASSKYRKTNPDAKLYYQAITSSKARNIECTITRKDIQIPTHCPYLGIELTNQGGWLNSNISIDRIDNTKGYVPGNIQVISRLANVMKHDASIPQLLEFARGVIKLHG